jgi:hypothetical protein
VLPPARGSRKLSLVEPVPTFPHVAVAWTSVESPFWLEAQFPSPCGVGPKFGQPKTDDAIWTPAPINHQLPGGKSQASTWLNSTLIPVAGAIGPRLDPPFCLQASSFSWRMPSLAFSSIAVFLE